MHWLLLGLFVLANGEIETRSSGYETAEASQPKLSTPVSAKGSDQQAYNSDGASLPEEPHPPANVQANPPAEEPPVTPSPGVEVHPPEPPPQIAQPPPQPPPPPPPPPVPEASESNSKGQYATAPNSGVDSPAPDDSAPPNGVQVHPPEPPPQVAQPPPCSAPPPSNPQPPPFHIDPIPVSIAAPGYASHPQPPPIHVNPPPQILLPPPPSPHPSPAVHRPPPSSGYAKPQLPPPPAPHPSPKAMRPQPSHPPTSGHGYKLTPVNSNYDKMAAGHPAPHVSAKGSDQLGYSNEGTPLRFVLVKKFSKFRRFSRV